MLRPKLSTPELVYVVAAVPDIGTNQKNFRSHSQMETQQPESDAIPFNQLPVDQQAAFIAAMHRSGIDPAALSIPSENPEPQNEPN
jgi:hypothetical protein